MGVYHNGRSEAVDRALCDFGIEESFVQASKRFKEHYKYDLGSSAVAKVTKDIAIKAEDYVANRLNEAGKNYGEIEDKSKVAKTMLVELDGCEIRTAVLQPKEGTKEVSPILNLPKKEKIINWRDIRIGLARPLDSVSKTYIGKKDFYPEVVGQLFNAAVLEGMTPETVVVGVADGGNGLKEELEVQFENMQFILDKTHLKDHLYDTAEAIGIDKKDRPGWVYPKLESISRGEVAKIREELEEEYLRNKNHRLKRLIGYIDRFYDAINYNEYKEKGYPIGSGEVESAHKSVPQKRMKISGACWHPESINPILALRILRADDWWDDFWKKRREYKIAA